MAQELGITRRIARALTAARADGAAGASKPRCRCAACCQRLVLAGCHREMVGLTTVYHWVTIDAVRFQSYRIELASHTTDLG